MENLHNLKRWGAVAAIAVVAIIPVQIAIFALRPPPADVRGFFELFEQSPLLGLLSLDLLYLLNNALMISVYLGLAACLYKANQSAIITALAVGLVGLATYYASSVAFEMMSLAKSFNGSSNPLLRQQLLAAGEGMLATYKGTAFDVYYILNAITLFIFSWVMLKERERTFTRTTALWGLASAALMIIPSTAGTIGLIFSLLSLVPWVVFSILIAGRMRKSQ